ncbi:LpqB family beta-propeller domain-containing protein [Nocardioides donggukensis]|uniref:GerMN domain-containing protein n=1 Tax=Nocardioides donggukensis TaxID=2774019 RepID=A0A927Q1M3_9ACTN|nr:LpqB family beta-propeller domain-containing protein [Nocardioides donggukensis]MBD8870272.1 GerMN domain-containing protein [Nocardioides donggukensis]
MTIPTGPTGPTGRTGRAGRAGRTGRAGLTRLLTALLLVGLSGACVRLPDAGPVEVGPERRTATLDEGFPYEPRPPQPGETPAEIVRHFLDAMTANPITTSVAREFLASSSRESWNPEERMITYADTSTPSGTSDVEVTLIDGNRLDSRGAWQGPLPDSSATVSFPMTVEDGEWRIKEAPNALIVSDSWFDERYRQVSLYFFDPSGEILVPEPVFVPRGGQLSTALVRGLLRGPAEGMRGVSRSFFPKGLRLDLSVPVSPNGLADVALQGDISGVDPETLELMTVQIAWTLRQDPSVERLRVTVGDTPVSQSGSSSDVPIVVGQIYDPTGVYAWQDLFGLRNGRLVASDSGRESRVRGPFGRRNYRLADVAIDLPAERAAVVSGNRSQLSLGPVSSGGAGDIRTLLTGASDLAKPAWDHSGRLWVLDRRPDGAQVSVYADGRRRVVSVPGISGENVIDFLVSRDGTRIAAALDRRGSDVVVLSRLETGGQTVRASRARTILEGVGEQLQLRDLGWRSPTDIVVLSKLSDALSEVRTFSVDGSPATQYGETATELIRDDIARLAASPVPNTPLWVVPSDGTALQLPPEIDAGVPLLGIQALTYVG